MEEEMTQVNVQMSVDLRAVLDEMVSQDESDRSKFIRLLIRKEHSRRQQPPLFPTHPTEKKNKRAATVAA